MNEAFQKQLKEFFERMGLREPSLTFDFENKKVDVFLSEGEWFKKWIPSLIHDFDHIVKLLARKAGFDTFFVDINNYRKERERLIVELAKAAARKVTTESQPVRLPAMNAYERRLVHVELAVHPTVRTESEGEGKERCVLIKPIE